MANTKSNDSKKIKNPLTGKNYIRGKKYSNPFNGKEQIFIAYIKNSYIKDGKYKGFYYPHFMSEEKWIAKENARTKRYEIIKEKIQTGVIKLVKSINPDTGESYKPGDSKITKGREYIFVCYETSYKGRIDTKNIEELKGSLPRAEKWTPKENYIRRRISRQSNTLRMRAKKSSIPYKISLDYLVSIYPKDNKCPVLKKEFSYGYDNDNKSSINNYSPSLDKIIPEKGYIEGNVVWVSRLVNQIKFDASIQLLEKIGNFYIKFEN